MSKFLEISMLQGSDDFEVFVAAVNRGIDSHLEAFTESNFSARYGRHYLNFHYDEIPLLLRRLTELGETDGPQADIANQWAGDIVETHYEVKCYE